MKEIRQAKVNILTSFKSKVSCNNNNNLFVSISIDYCCTTCLYEEILTSLYSKLLLLRIIIVMNVLQTAMAVHCRMKKSGATSNWEMSLRLTIIIFSSTCPPIGDEHHMGKD